MSQLNLAPYLGLNEPPTDSLDDAIGFLVAKPNHVLHSKDRTFTADTSRLPSYVLENGEPANFLVVTKADQMYLRRVAGQIKQFNALTGRPVKACDYDTSLDALRTALEDVVRDGPVDIGNQVAGNLRFARHYTDFDDNEEYFPLVYDYSGRGDFNEVPELEDISTINSRSLIAVAFTVKLWDKASLGRLTNAGSSPSSPVADDQAEASSSKGGKKGSSGAKKGKGKAAAPDAKPRAYGARLEMTGIVYLGRDDDGPGQMSSPRKMPRF